MSLMYISTYINYKYTYLFYIYMYSLNENEWKFFRTTHTDRTAPHIKVKKKKLYVYIRREGTLKYHRISIYVCICEKKTLMKIKSNTHIQIIIMDFFFNIIIKKNIYHFHSLQNIIYVFFFCSRSCLSKNGILNNNNTISIIIKIYEEKI